MKSTKQKKVSNTWWLCLDICLHKSFNDFLYGLNLNSNEFSQNNIQLARQPWVYPQQPTCIRWAQSATVHKHLHHKSARSVCKRKSNSSYLGPVIIHSAKRCDKPWGYRSIHEIKPCKLITICVVKWKCLIWLLWKINS